MSGKKNNIFTQLCKHRSLSGESDGEDVTPDGEVLSTPRSQILQHTDVSNKQKKKKKKKTEEEEEARMRVRTHNMKCLADLEDLEHATVRRLFSDRGREKFESDGLKGFLLPGERNRVSQGRVVGRVGTSDE